MTAASTPQPPQRDGDDEADGAGGSEEKSGTMHDADVANGENPAE